MVPFSKERLSWIEGRLFCLARMLGELRVNGVRNAVGHQMASSSNEASLLVQQAINSIQVERLQLMAERRSIEEYDSGS